ncbi:hypothetical protein MHM582_3287, partial [Microbacterium sp. HM58-2]
EDPAATEDPGPDHRSDR